MPRKRIRTGIIILCATALIGAGVVGLRSLQRAGWEQSLREPYLGAPFLGQITSNPVSTLTIPPQGRLEVYELPSQIGPVLVMRSESGEIQWTRVLVPEQRSNDGNREQAWIRELRLHNIEQSSHGPKVFITCDWEWGGKEGGLIDLDRDYSFKSFRLSW